MMQSWITFILVFGIILIAGLFTYFVPVLHWYIASHAGVRITLAELIRLRINRQPIDAIVDATIRSKHYDLKITKDQVITLAGEGHNVVNIVNGLLAARKHGIILTYEEALEADRRGIDIERGIDAIRMKKTEEAKQRKRNHPTLK